MSSAPHPDARRSAGDDGRPPGPIHVGDYLLLHRLGEGGMGVVHLAQRPGGPRVALKVLRPQVVADQAGRERLAQEVGSLSLVRSPRVAEILDSDPWGDIPYVVTRYVPGLSLHDHVAEEGPITGSDLRWFAWCLGDALAAVHAAGVLHRDVKPGNVLMEGRSPVLIDFGLARVADDPRLTQTGWLLGTPGYLAPEILHGDDATPASDVHAWAATVAYAGTGRPPFGRGPTMAVMDRVRRGQHDLEGVPSPLRDALHAALAPEPDDRPTLRQLHGWLRRQVGGPPASAVPPAAPAAPAASAAPPTAPVTAPAPAPVPAPAPRTRPEEVFPGWGPAVDAPPAPAAPPTRAQRAGLSTRRAVLLGALAVALGTLVAAAPWPTTAALAVAVWLLRAVSLSGSAQRSRRAVRGPRWFDPPLQVLAAPWHVLRALPMTLLLLLWALGIGLAGMLVGYAVEPAASTVLGLGGTAAAAGLWLGPGASRVRQPVEVLLRPLARATWAWVGTLVVVVLVATVLGLRVRNEGVDWAPAEGPPLQGLRSWIG